MRNPILARVLTLSCLATGPVVLAQTSSFVNFESGQSRPLALSPSGKLLFAVNTPDNRLELFRIVEGGLIRVGETVVGMEPVAVSAAGEDTVFVVNHLSDSVSVVDVSNPGRPFVSRTLWTGDEPADIVVAGPNRDKVFVTAAHRGQNRPGDPQFTTPGVGRADVWVWNISDLDAPARVLTLFADSPRALASSPDGRTVYAAAFHSGNRTTTLSELAVDSFLLNNTLINDGFSAPGLPAPLANIQGVPAPVTGLIVRWLGGRWLDAAGRDWTPRVRFNLPDRDVFVIDAAAEPPRETDSFSGVGTTLFNMAVNPADGRLYVSNLESRNHVRFEPALAGHIAENRITIIDGGTVSPIDLNPHIDYRTPFGSPQEIALSLAFPLGMQFSGDGSRLYVAAFGSGRVGIYDSEARLLDTIRVGGGPTGLALNEARDRLYVLNRFDQTISIVDTARRDLLDTIPLRYNPEPLAVREGRRFLYDATASGHGDSACASCHIFGDNDGLAWDLGDPDGLLAENPLEQVDIQVGDVALRPFHPMKGPMTTQSLRGMLGAGAMHWRGDRNGDDQPFDERLAFMQFRPAFQTLLGKETELPVDQMEKFRDFILSVRYPPNPVANLDGTLSADQAAGKAIFEGGGGRRDLGGDGDPCSSCHTLPRGTDGHASFEGLTQDFKVAHLRNLYTKVGMFGYAIPSITTDQLVIPTIEPTPTPEMGDQVRGFGFLHDGSIPTLLNFFRLPTRQFTFLDRPGSTGNQRIRQLESFLLAFPTGLAPAVGQQVTLDQDHLQAVAPRFQTLQDRAGAGDGDLVIHGLHRGETRGWLYLGQPNQGGGRFQSDRSGEIVTRDQLAAAVQAGEAVLTATLVPPGSGRRIGIDRDLDGILDGDERVVAGASRTWRPRR